MATKDPRRLYSIVDLFAALTPEERTNLAREIDYLGKQEPRETLGFMCHKTAGLCYVLSNLFHWDKSLMGDDYWRSVFERLEDN